MKSILFLLLLSVSAFASQDEVLKKHEARIAELEKKVTQLHSFFEYTCFGYCATKSTSWDKDGQISNAGGVSGTEDTAEAAMVVLADHCKDDGFYRLVGDDKFERKPDIKKDCVMHLKRNAAQAYRR